MIQLKVAKRIFGALTLGLLATAGTLVFAAPAGAAGTIAQTQSATVTVGHDYLGQVLVSGGNGPVGFSQTSGAPDIEVNSAGQILAPATLAVGTYNAGGEDEDGSGDTGSWSFSLQVVPPVSTPATGYLEVGRDGGIFAFGSAPFYGSIPQLGITVNNIVAAVPDQTVGYWLFGSDGGVFAFGSAPYLGSLPQMGVVVDNIVGAVPTQDGQGYWLVGADGGVFAFGDAGYVGSIPQDGVVVSNIVGIIPTPDNQGYWMVGSDGGIFGFGDAPYLGSLPGDNIVSNDVIGMASAGGLGYYIVTSAGIVYSLLQSLKSIYSPATDIVGVAGSGTGGGLYMVGRDGGVFSFGDAQFFGSLPQLGIPVDNVVAIIAG